jgi:hypothetical protein
MQDGYGIFTAKRREQLMWRTLDCSALPLRLALPSGWVVREAADQLVVATEPRLLTEPPTTHGARLACLGGRPDQFGRITDPVELVRLFCDGFAVGDTPPLRDVQLLTIGGQPAARLHLRGWQGRAKTYVQLTAIVEPQTVLVLVALDAEAGRWAPLLDQIAARLTFVP